MPATLNEHTQFVDDAGKPLVDGKVYFGVQGADPKVSPVSIFSDRELTTPLANPQALDSSGRTANKVWVEGRYSIVVDDLNDVQKYQNLDNGETAAGGVTSLENVAGGNTITADATTTITEYIDLEIYSFRAASANTTGVTLNIDGVGAKSVLKNHDQPILPGEFEATQNIIVIRNETDDVFEWVNHNNKVIDFYEGSPVASAATANIWATDGNTVHLTGSTGPVTSFGTAPNVGARRLVICDSTPTFTNSANLNLQGGADYTATAGDVLWVYADTTTQFDVQIFKSDGTPIVTPVKGVVQVKSVLKTDTFTTTSTSFTDVTGLTVSITPSSADNDIMVMVLMGGYGAAGNVDTFWQIVRDSTPIAIGDAAGNRVRSTLAGSHTTLGAGMDSGGMNAIDSPATTSSTTYKIQARLSSAGTLYFNRSNDDIDTTGRARTVASIIVIEMEPEIVP